MSLIPFGNRKVDYPVDPNNDLAPPAFMSGLGHLSNKNDFKQDRYFSLSLDDINRYKKEKLRKNIQIYEKVLGRCYHKIREYVLHNQNFCFFGIPEYMPGYPLFNITHCMFFMMKKLRSAKYTVDFVPPNILYISWSIPATLNAPPVNNSNMRRVPLRTFNGPDPISPQKYSSEEKKLKQTTMYNYASQEEEPFLFG